ncbi:hypothetical protein [Commensalibacter sp. Nvir]|uniref:hypothetical protein n=1 Tax=Commensalibacter sp. Nvir TaxID=3069817 RepID=UPI0030C7CE34
MKQFHKTIDINQHFEEKTLYGWHTNESNTYRWTNGNAWLPFDHVAITNNTRLIIEIKNTNTYIQQTEKQKQYA